MQALAGVWSLAQGEHPSLARFLPMLAQLPLFPTAPQARALLAAGLPVPAYEMMVKASHTFNLLDARRAISVTERQRYILRVRTLARAIAEAYYATREALGFPLLPVAAREALAP